MFESESGHKSPANRIRFATRSGFLEYQECAGSTQRATTPPVSTHDLLIISNPPAGHPGVVGVKHAERWVRQGRAFFEAGGRLRLMERHRQSLGRSMRGSASSGVGYDAIKRQMLQRERRHIPIAQPPPRPTKRKIVVAHSGPTGGVKTYTEAELAERLAKRRSLI
jgi:hypothetical protein